jgi:hypothetical protein
MTARWLLLVQARSEAVMKSLDVDQWLRDVEQEQLREQHARWREYLDTLPVEGREQAYNFLWFLRSRVGEGNEAHWRLAWIDVQPPERIVELMTFWRERLFAGLTAKQLLDGLTPEEILDGLTPEHLLAGLSPEEQIAALSPEALEEIRRRIANEKPADPK